jgi:hypothetical protein
MWSRDDSYKEIINGGPLARLCGLYKSAFLPLSNSYALARTLTAKKEQSGFANMTSRQLTQRNFARAFSPFLERPTVRYPTQAYPDLFPNRFGRFSPTVNRNRFGFVSETKGRKVEPAHCKHSTMRMFASTKIQELFKICIALTVWLTVMTGIVIFDIWMWVAHRLQ